jgi:uncharacterized Zn-binding protein involved in type VI secretion
MPFAARIADPTSHGMPATPGIGSINVFIGNKPAWRAMMDTCVCPIPIAPPAPAPHGPENCYLGSTTVLINNQMACRQADILQGGGPPNPFVMGAPNVIIGDVGFGMASVPSMTSFLTAMLQLELDWDDLSADERLEAMQDAINSATSEHMPALTISPTDLGENTLGELDFQNWQIDLNEDLLSGEMDSDMMAQLVNTIYHEGRHGEQWFNIAQHRASEGDSSQTIARDTALPQEVTDAAVANPAPAGTSEGEVGEAMHTSVYGDRRDHREGVFEDMDNDVDGSYDSYRALPEEEDAWRQGDAAESEYRNLP